jgi:hypothetical protein
MSNPSHPSLLDEVSTPGIPYYVAFKDSLIFVDAFNGLLILGIGDTIHPTPLSQIDGGPGQFAVADSFVYWIYSSAVGRYAIVDVSNPLLPVVRSTAVTEEEFPGMIAYKDHYLYISQGFTNSSNLEDVSDPDHPIQVGNVFVGSEDYMATIQDTLMYVGRLGGIEIFDVSSMPNPVLTGYVDTINSTVQGIVLDDTIVYAACTPGGILRFSIANPTNPFVTGWGKQVREVASGLQSYSITRLSDAVAAATSAGFDVYGVAQGDTLPHLAFVPTAGGGYSGSAVRGNSLYLASGLAGLRIAKW